MDRFYLFISVSCPSAETLTGRGLLLLIPLCRSQKSWCGFCGCVVACELSAKLLNEGDREIPFVKT